ncbi:cupin domain-containing protein [Alicyclobacillus cycloheptanicus]|uniref:Acireductone dioxygenase n=1 Tax=Alicyclobacillus cycloheptanicus TaxID=1457 RepID=A0ABT9XHK4_9BACL|nr:cupin domain-containing protein [Alicyclobacillus cycloheptanicus]MDQ0189794.1 1,2-dihydroxy-3-keto-5-methylthiopentene dioxygenase [Alicyclobacillus cycloheptanicus]WDM02514.1 cupin domain-containing protein [Alicyclobacillus cycloheptanicus]
MATIRIRNTGEQLVDEANIRQFLTDNGVYYDHWSLDAIPAALHNRFQLDDAEKEEILKSLAPQIEALAQARGYVKWDVVAMSEATPNLDEILKKFEQIHTHTEDEVRVMAAGSGVFIIKGKDGGYFDVELTAGDVISVPEHTPHYFTVTAERKFVAVRLFIDPSGWVAHPYDDPAFTQA